MASVMSRWKKAQFKSGMHKQCTYCRKALTLFTATVDHVLPKARGGTNSVKNFTLACAKCNLRKGHKDVEPGQYKSDEPEQDVIYVGQMLPIYDPTELIAANDASDLDARIVSTDRRLVRAAEVLVMTIRNKTGPEAIGRCLGVVTALVLKRSKLKEARYRELAKSENAAIGNGASP